MFGYRDLEITRLVKNQNLAAELKSNPQVFLSDLLNGAFGQLINQGFQSIFFCNNGSLHGPAATNYLLSLDYPAAYFHGGLEKAALLGDDQLRLLSVCPAVTLTAHGPDIHRHLPIISRLQKFSEIYYFDSNSLIENDLDERSRRQTWRWRQD